MNTRSRYDPLAPVPCDTCWRRSRCTAFCKALNGWLNDGDKAVKSVMVEPMTLVKLAEKYC